MLANKSQENFGLKHNERQLMGQIFKDCKPYYLISIKINLAELYRLKNHLLWQKRLEKEILQLRKMNYKRQ